MQIDVTVQDANNILCEVTPPQPQIIVVDRGVEGNGIVSIVPVTISTFQYLRITYTNGTVQDVGPLTSTAYTATAPITIVGNTISLATVPIASGGTDATTAAGAIQNLLPSYTGNANKRLGLNSLGTALEWVLDGGGTVTSVAASGGTTGLTFTGSPITTSGTLTLGGTLAVANGGTGVTSSTGTGSVVLSTSPTLVTPVLGTPTSGNFSTGTFTWPTFNQNTTGTAANITATSNSTLTTLSALSLPGSQVSGNISGNAANVTGVVAIANGGTGQTTANAAFNALAPSQTGNSGKYLTTDGSNTSWATNPLGTVTSVAATVPSFLSVSGSPITTSGTLAFSLSGTALPTTSGGTGLTSFTANGVVYASSTSALTTGSALTFDGTNLGVGGSLNTSAGRAVLTLNAATDTAISFGRGGTSVGFILQDAGGQTFYNSENTYQRFYINATEQMRLTSTGLGIGTSSPAQKLTVTNNVGIVGANSDTLTSGSYLYLRGDSGSGSGQGVIAQINAAYGLDLWGYNSGWQKNLTLTASGNLGIGTSSPAYKLDVVDNSTGTQARIASSSSYGTSLSFVSTSTNGRTYRIGSNFALGNGEFSIYDATGSVERLQISASGNLGLGVTPSAWSNMRAMDIGDGAFAISADGAGSGDGSTTWNGYYNGTSWTYKYTGGVATRYRQNESGHAWFTAPSGTAGNAITFTQAMTLDASGNLVLGTTSSLSATSGRTDLTINGSNTAILSLGVGGVRQGYLYTPTTGVILTSETNTLNLQTSASYPIVFNTNATERARIDSSGNFGIGTSSPRKKLDVNGSAIVESGILNTSSYYETTLLSPYFTNGVSDLAVDVRFGNLSFWGYIELEISGTYSNQNVGGKLSKLFAVGTNPGGAIYTNEARVTDCIGATSNGFTIGEFSWDSANNTFKIPIYHVNSLGNGINVRVKQYAVGGGAYDVFSALTLSSLYTSSAIAPISGVNFNTAIGIGGASATGSGYGITFPATQSPSSNANTLDDYEEGTWTPIWTGGSSNPTITYNEQQGRYIKIGKMVYISIRIVVASSSGGGGVLRLSGLPFTTNATGGNPGYISLTFSYGWSSSEAALSFIPTTSSTSLDVYTQYAGYNSNIQTTVAALNAGGTIYVIAGGCYEAAN